MAQLVRFGGAGEPERQPQSLPQFRLRPEQERGTGYGTMDRYRRGGEARSRQEGRDHRTRGIVRRCERLFERPGADGEGINAYRRIQILRLVAEPPGVPRRLVEPAVF